MYADRVEAVTKRSVKDRLNGNTSDDYTRRRLIAGKRHREDDDKWEHDLYESGEAPGSSQRIGTKDLRLKLQKKSIQQATQSVRGSVSGGMRDLREKLSGTVYSQTVENDPPKAKMKVAPEISKPVRRSITAEAPAMETKKVASTVSKKKSQQKFGRSFSGHTSLILLCMRMLWRGLGSAHWTLKYGWSNCIIATYA